jgi:hypothetical protein
MDYLPGMRCKLRMPHVSVMPRRFNGAEKKEKPYVETMPAKKFYENHQANQTRIAYTIPHQPQCR